MPPHPKMRTAEIMNFVANLRIIEPLAARD